MNNPINNFIKSLEEIVEHIHKEDITPEDWNKITNHIDNLPEPTAVRMITFILGFPVMLARDKIEKEKFKQNITLVEKIIFDSFFMIKDEITRNPFGIIAKLFQGVIETDIDMLNGLAKKLYPEGYEMLREVLQQEDLEKILQECMNEKDQNITTLNMDEIKKILKEYINKKIMEEDKISC